MNRKLVLAFALLLLAGNAAAQTATSTVTVQVENRAITLTNTGGLNFGTILPYGSPGSVTVGSNGAYSASNAFVSNAANISASSWSVTGIPGAPYAVTLPTSVTISNGTETMTVSSFNRSGAAQLLLDAGGNGTFNVGARLNVGTNQPAGTYAGTFNVNYN
jgi:hypothetical protein